MGTSALPESLELHEIDDSPAASVRDGLDGDHADYLMGLIESGVQLDPPIVYTDGVSFWLVDGRHRLKAHEALGRNSIKIDCLKRSWEDALWDAAGANAKHGKASTEGDKRRAIETALKARPDESGRVIGEKVGACESYVRKVRNQLRTVRSCEDGESLASQLERRVGRDGKTRRMPTKTTPPPDEQPETGGDPLFEDVMAEDAAMMNDLRNRVLAVKRVIDEYDEDPERRVFPHNMHWSQDLGLVANLIGQYTPTGVCPTCNGDGEGRGDYADGRSCRECQGTGYDCKHIQRELNNERHYSTAG